jgi:hypothetical protein
MYLECEYEIIALTFREGLITVMPVRVRNLDAGLSWAKGLLAGTILCGEIGVYVK